MDRIQLRRNSPPALLYEDAVRNEGAIISSSGALINFSGKKTGRSPKDKRIVYEETSKDLIWWGPVNIKLDERMSFRIPCLLITHVFCYTYFRHFRNKPRACNRLSQHPWARICVWRLRGCKQCFPSLILFAASNIGSIWHSLFFLSSMIRNMFRTLLSHSH